jgi:hypothetical protein
MKVRQQPKKRIARFRRHKNWENESVAKYTVKMTKSDPCHQLGIPSLFLDLKRGFSRIRRRFQTTLKF